MRSANIDGIVARKQVHFQQLAMESEVGISRQEHHQQQVDKHIDVEPTVDVSTVPHPVNVSANQRMEQ